MLTPQATEAMLGVSRRTLMRMEQRGDIESHRLPSGHRRFKRIDVETLLSGVA